ncbi:hypothetical protein GCM10010099_22610 [Streptomyces cinereus]|nr:hypothetical protein GCM10010099_22610 [Streptomyces cinereus]
MNAEVSPEVVDGLLTAGFWLVDLIDTYGPGLVAAAIAGAGWWALCRTADHRNSRRWNATGRRQTAIEAAPPIPTQPSHDQTDLDTCNAIWNATQARKETDQP